MYTKEQKDMLTRGSIEELSARMNKFNVQSWVDVRDFAAIVAFGEERGYFRTNRASEVVSWVVVAFVNSLLEKNPDMKTFTYPSEAVDFLERRMFSMEQMKVGKRKHAATFPLQLEDIIRTKLEMQRKDIERQRMQREEINRKKANGTFKKEMDEFKRQNPGRVVSSDDYQPSTSLTEEEEQRVCFPGLQIEPAQTNELTEEKRQAVFDSTDDDGLVFNDETDVGVESIELSSEQE